MEIINSRHFVDIIVLTIPGLFIGYFILTYVIRMFRDFREITGSEATLHEGARISTQNFYARIESALSERQLNEIRLGRRYYKEHGGISQKREYLAISYRNLLFLICAAPYGTGFFISWWSGERMSFIKELVFSIPLLGPKLSNWLFKKTYFQLDTEAMFRVTVMGCLNESVKDMITNKGIRVPSSGSPMIVHNSQES